MAGLASAVLPSALPERGFRVPLGAPRRSHTSRPALLLLLRLDVHGADGSRRTTHAGPPRAFPGVRGAASRRVRGPERLVNERQRWIACEEHPRPGSSVGGSAAQDAGREATMNAIEPATRRPGCRGFSTSADNAASCAHHLPRRRPRLPEHDARLERSSRPAEAAWWGCFCQEDGVRRSSRATSGTTHGREEEKEGGRRGRWRDKRGRSCAT